VWDYENGFYWFSHPTRLNKLLTHYELYRSMLNLPGDAIELGVYKVASLIRLASFRQLLENDYARKIVGFDTLGRFPREGLGLAADLAFIDSFEAEVGPGLTRGEAEAIFRAKNFRNITLVAGNIFETLPAYLEQSPATRITLLHLDLDTREPTAFALAQLYPRVVPNGLIVLDDYTAVAGGSVAVDEFQAQHRLVLEKSRYNHVPSFLRKPVA